MASELTEGYLGVWMRPSTTYLASLGAAVRDWRFLAESSPPTYEIARSKPAGQDVPPQRLLSGDEVGRGDTRTRPTAGVPERRLSGASRGSAAQASRALGLALHDDGACRHLVAMADVPDFEAYQVASAWLAVDAQVEERKFAHAALHLKADA